MSGAAFAHQEGLSYNQLRYWVRKLEKPDKAKFVAVPSLETRPLEVPLEDVPLKLHFGPCQLEIPAGFHGPTLLRILHLFKQVS